MKDRRNSNVTSPQFSAASGSECDNNNKWLNEQVTLTITRHAESHKSAWLKKQRRER